MALCDPISMYSWSSATALPSHWEGLRYKEVSHWERAKLCCGMCKSLHWAGGAAQRSALYRGQGGFPRVVSQLSSPSPPSWGAAWWVKEHLLGRPSSVTRRFPAPLWASVSPKKRVLDWVLSLSVVLGPT